MKKIIFINCYFGNFPWYFSFFIKSCANNPTVDFLIFSDEKYDGNIPKNLRIIPFTLLDFNLLATQKLGFKIDIKDSYKLCDFKPSYGKLFSEYLTTYDFWGMCDIDIILGRIREFVTDDLLDEYDIVNTRHDYLTGSFLLFRNTEAINNLFRKSNDYQKVFTSEKHYCFDECNFKHIEMEQGISIFEVECEIESMEHIIRKEIVLGNLNVFFDFLVVDGLCGKLKWENGILGYNNKFEVLLFHLIQYKSNLLTQKLKWLNIPNVFYIDKYNFRIKEKTNIFGLFSFMFFDKIKPFVFKVAHYFEYFISIKIRPQMVTNIEIGIFKNKLGATILDINHDVEGNNVIVNYFMPESHTKLIKSKLNNKAFFFKGFAFQKCIQTINKNTLEVVIQRNESDGNISNFEGLNKKHKPNKN